MDALLPQTRVVIGRGKVGLTIAEALRKNQGADVTVVEKNKRIAGDVKPSFKCGTLPGRRTGYSMPDLQPAGEGD